MRFKGNYISLLDAQVYDSFGLFAAAGGNLGLCLGLSCLSLLLSLLELIEKKALRKVI
jgi:hypothetical protein